MPTTFVNVTNHLCLHYPKPYKPIGPANVQTVRSEAGTAVFAFEALTTTLSTPLDYIQGTAFRALGTPAFFSHIKTFMKRLS